VIYANTTNGAEPKKYDFFNCGVYTAQYVRNLGPNPNAPDDQTEEYACSPNTENHYGLVCTDGSMGADNDWSACGGYENRAACPIGGTSTPIMCNSGSCEATGDDCSDGVRYGAEACEAEETTTTTTTEPSDCACYAEIEMLVDTLRSDLQTQLGDELRVQIPAGILAEFQDMSEEFSSTLTPIIAEQLTERIPDALEQAFRNMSSVLSQQLVSTLQPLFLQVENFTNMPDDLKEALTTSLADEFVPISALQTIFESLEESLRTSLSSGLSSVLDEYYVSKEDLADMPAQMQEDLQNSLSPYFMAMADMEDLANLDVNLGSALAETLPNIFATKEEVDSLSATVSMLEMDNNEVITGMSDMASCMADIAGSMGSDDGSDDTPVETAAPTEYWETLGRLMER